MTAVRRDSARSSFFDAIPGFRPVSKSDANSGWLRANRLTILLLVLVVLIQWPLWFGKGGWLRVGELEKQLRSQESVNAKLTARNQALVGEVNDLKTGMAAIEERARTELDMIQPGEIFVSVKGSK